MILLAEVESAMTVSDALDVLGRDNAAVPVRYLLFLYIFTKTILFEALGVPPASFNCFLTYYFDFDDS